MDKMYIQLDEEKVNRLRRYDYNSIWKCIDEIFIKNHCKIEIQEDGAHLYSSDEQRTNQQTADIGLCFIALQAANWFAESVKEWFWIEEDGEEDLIDYELESNSGLYSLPLG